jgi:aldehyde dehydrogenase
VVLKPAEQTPASILVLMELIGDLLPAGRAERGERLRGGGGQAAGVEQPRIGKIAFTGETTTGRLISAVRKPAT